MERDEFLTKAINPDWFDGSYDEAPIIVFSSWFGFGRLWEWSRKQKWWEDFFEKTFERDVGSSLCDAGCKDSLLEDFINPDLFADAVYRYLKEREYGTK
jgi:hypothetical protein